MGGALSYGRGTPVPRDARLLHRLIACESQFPHQKPVNLLRILNKKHFYQCKLIEGRVRSVQQASVALSSGSTAVYRAVVPSSGSNIIPRRLRPGLAGLRRHNCVVTFCQRGPDYEYKYFEKCKIMAGRIHYV